MLGGKFCSSTLKSELPAEISLTLTESKSGDFYPSVELMKNSFKTSKNVYGILSKGVKIKPLCNGSI